MRVIVTTCWPIRSTWFWARGLAEGRTYVAEEEGSLVGFATWIEADGIFELEDLFVDPGWRRRGIAATLVSHIVQVLRARGVRRLAVTANLHAMGFYRAVGFIGCGARSRAVGERAQDTTQTCSEGGQLFGGGGVEDFQVDGPVAVDDPVPQSHRLLPGVFPGTGL